MNFQTIPPPLAGGTGGLLGPGLCMKPDRAAQSIPARLWILGHTHYNASFVLIRLRDGSQRRPKTHWWQFGLYAALRIFLPILFPTIPRWHGDFRVFRMSPMHRLGIVPQSLPGEPFRETAFQRPLRTGMTLSICREVAGWRMTPAPRV